MQLSTDEEPDPELTKPADPVEEITTQDEEVTNPDPVEEPATPEAETTLTKMANTAIFARFKATGRKNAGRG